jgi:hypothetical protein
MSVQNFQIRDAQCKLCQNRDGAVGGLVIDDDYLADFRLRGDRLDRSRYGCFFVAGRDDG